MKKRSIISLVLTAAMFLTACGGAGGGGSESGSGVSKANSINKDGIYKEEKNYITLPEGEDLRDIILAGDTLYVGSMIYNYGDEGIMPRETILKSSTAEIAVDDVAVAEEAVAEEAVTEEAAAEEVMEEPIQTAVFTAYDKNGTEKNSVAMPMENNEGMGSFQVDNDGNIYRITYLYPSYEGEDTTEKVYLKACDSTGKELWSLWLNEKVSKDEYYYVQKIFMTEKNQLALTTSRGVELYDLKGAPVNLIEVTNAGSTSYYPGKGDTIVCMEDTGESASMRVLDLATGAFGESVKVPFNLYRYSIFGQSFERPEGEGYDLYLTDNYGVYGYNMGDESITVVMDYISSEFASDYMTYLIFADEKTFFASYWEEGRSVISKFTKVPPEEVPDKVELTLGCYYLDSNVKTQLVEFNKSNMEYRIRIRDYSIYDTMTDYTQGITKLNTDIISGDVPDIMILNNDMPINSYISKGIFADLYTFMEQDEDFRKEDLLPNVFEALETGDSLYQISPSFSVSTFGVKTSEVGEKTTWTMDEAIALLESKPEGTSLLGGEVTSQSFLYNVMVAGMDEFVNWETGECSFDGQGFKKALEFAKTFPKEINYDDVMYDDSYWAQMETQYRDGRTLVASIYLSGYRDYARAKYATFGEDVTLIGFPTENGQGAGLNMYTKYAISAQSEYQEQAWEFLKGFFTEEYQDSLQYEFPVRISSLEKLEQEAQSRPYHINDKGEKEEYDDTYYIGDAEIIIEPLTREEAAKVTDYLKSITQLINYNQTINEIITEETEAFFAGQKTVDEVVSVIQSRVKIYVNENR